MTAETATTVTADARPRPVAGVCDVVVVGAGPAGSACAIELARNGREVLIVERGDYCAPRIGETLAPAGQGPLASLGACGLLTDPPHRKAHGLRSVWGESRIREHSYMFDPHAVGWHLDRAAFDASLAALAASRGVRVAVGERLVGLEERTGGWRLCFRDARGFDAVMRCRFVIDATGRPAAVARRLGARTVAVDRLVAHYCVLAESATALEPVTMIEAISKGWWYTAPLPDGRLVVALLTDHDGESRGRAERWLRALLFAPCTSVRCVSAWALEPAAARRRPDRASHASARRVRTTCARSTLTTPTHGDRWLAAGDAAIARDPLAGNGIERALSDGIRAARTVNDALDGARDALPARAERLLAEHTEYLAARAATYALERRWPDADFWRARAGAHQTMPISTRTGEPKYADS